MGVRATVFHARWTCVLPFAFCFSAATARPQSYPNPYPRQNAGSVLTNDRVNIWQVTWPKGQPTAMHEHPFDQLSVTLTGGIVRVTRLGSDPIVNQSKVGSVAFTPKGTIHVEEGLSDFPQRKIMLELKPSPSPPMIAMDGVPPAFPREGAVKLLENDRVIAWDFTWKPGRTVARQDRLDSVTVFLEGGTIRYLADQGGARDTVRSAGEVVYSSHSQAAHTEEAIHESPRAVIVELK